uniref:Uncharacterized protein n=1 Tax=Marinomonas sp. (strain MWYL1) TaxID=400668 RepID=A6W0N5_MARMS
MDDQDTQQTGITYSHGDKETYAHNFGSNLDKYTNLALDINGYDSGMATTNSHVGNDSRHVANNTKEYQGLNKEQGENSVIPYIAPTVELLAPRLLSMIGTGAAGLALSKSLEKLNESPEFDQMTDTQKMAAYYTLYEIAKDQEINKTETLPVDHAINSTGGSEIVAQGPTTTTLPMTEKEASDYVLTTPKSNEISSNTETVGEDPSVFGLGAVNSEQDEKSRDSVLSGANVNHVNGTIGELRGYQDSLNNGHIGIKAPGKVTAPGVDYITYDPESGEIILWDSKYRKEGGSYPSSVSESKTSRWKVEAKNAIEKMPEGALKNSVLKAFENGKVKAEISRWPK